MNKFPDELLIIIFNNVVCKINISKTSKRWLKLLDQVNLHDINDAYYFCKPKTFYVYLIEQIINPYCLNYLTHLYSCKTYYATKLMLFKQYIKINYLNSKYIYRLIDYFRLDEMTHLLNVAFTSNASNEFLTMLLKYMIK
jgi:hypothetical protein